MTKKAVKEVLAVLDEEYGTSKEGFLHFANWQLLLAIMLSAQSTDKQVYDALPGLWKRFDTIDKMAEADIDEIESYIKSVGLYKSKAKNMKRCCEQIINEFHGEVPDTIEELITLAGVGRKSATLYLADAFDIPGVTVDTHVLRIAKRLGWAKGNNPVTVEKELMKVLPKENWNRINFQLIYHGRAVCSARKCHCEECKLEQWCKKADVPKEKKKA
ncbi:endonuclease III [Lachnospiraceae bacterium KM106-2]|nr:endonuclease III [Lachnospiraceae bacterium KM106-2]